MEKVLKEKKWSETVFCRFFLHFRDMLYLIFVAINNWIHGFDRRGIVSA